MLTGTQVLKLGVAGDLDQLCDALRQQLSLAHVSTAGWNQRRDDFLTSLDERVAQTAAAPAVRGDAAVPAGTDHMLYDGRTAEGYDFRAVEARLNPDKNGEVARGRLTVEPGGVLCVERSNALGRFQVWLQKYVVSGVEKAVVPRSTAATGRRKLKIAFAAKVAGGHHTVTMIVKSKLDDSWLAAERVRVREDTWTPIEALFRGLGGPRLRHSFRRRRGVEGPEPALRPESGRHRAYMTPAMTAAAYRASTRASTTKEKSEKAGTSDAGAVRQPTLQLTAATGF